MRTSYSARTMRFTIIVLMSCSAVLAQQPMPGPNHGAGNVLGGPALATTGAIPYVSAPGVLSQDTPGICWDAVNERLGIGTCSPTTRLHIIDSTGATIRLVRTSNRFEIEADNSLMSLVARDAGDIAVVTSGGEKLRVLENGNLLIGTTTDGNFKLDVANSGSAGTFRAYDSRATIGTTKVVVRAGAGQTGSLQEWQNAAGTEIGNFASNGAMTAGYFTATGANYFSWAGRTQMHSPGDGLVMLINNANTDFNRLQFGGTTSSFPSIQRSTTKLFFRLADDSAGAVVRAGGYESSDGTAGATVTTCTGFKNGLCISGT